MSSLLSFFSRSAFLFLPTSGWTASRPSTGNAFWRPELTRPDNAPAGINHRLILGNKAIIIQMLTNLSSLDSDDFTLAAVPLRLDGLDGSPARVFAMIND